MKGSHYKPPGSKMKFALALITISILIFLARSTPVLALNPSLKVGEYARTTGRVRNGFSPGNIYAMAQTPDGYLWFGREFRLIRFDSIRKIPWQPSAGQHLPDKTIHSARRKSRFRGDREGRADSSPRHKNSQAQGGHARVRDLKFTHLTTNDGLSQGYVTAILQDHRGFMWFATRDGLNRYDGNSFVVYKHDPNDPASLSSNFLQDLLEDEHGYLWISTNTGVNKFDPATERFTRYVHDRKNPEGIGSAYVTSIARDNRGYLWFGTADSGLDRFDPTSGKFTHYGNDSHGEFVGRITKVIATKQGEIWFVGERGLFHLNQQRGQIDRPSAIGSRVSAEGVYEDDACNLWMLTDSPFVGLMKYDPEAERVTKYPFSPAIALPASTVNGGSTNGNLLADGQNGLWVPSSLGLSYFDRRTERFTYRFRHDETDPDSLDSNAILSVYRDQGGVLWVGTENAGLNILNFKQEQFVHYRHRAGDPDSLSPGRVKAIYEEPNGILWVGFFPRALDRLDRKTGTIIHYVPNRADESALGEGANVDDIYKDASGYLWIGGGGSGLDRFDERTGRFKHYRHKPDDPHSLISDNVLGIYGDRNGQMWVAQQYGISRFDPVTHGFNNYQPVPDDSASLTNWIDIVYRDRSGTLWLGTFGGALLRFDDKAKTFVNDMPDPDDPQKLKGAGITTIHEDHTGTLWVGTFDGLYRYNRQNKTFTRYTEIQGLPSSTIRCILEDGVGRLWLSTQRGISRFDPQRGIFRNYDVSDGLQSNEFSTGCYQGSDGEIFFGGSNGFNAFFPENVRDNPYVPPVVITGFKIFNKPVPIGGKSILQKSIPYVDSLTLFHRANVFSFEFASLSYANSHKNRYRYKLENFDPDWNEVGSKQRLATYTNLDPGKYVFRVEGSNSDGVWNEEGVSLPILITPPWWRTNWFRAICGGAVLVLLWAAYELRIRQLHHEFDMTLEARVGERTRIARDLHDTLLQSFHGLVFRFQAARNMLPNRPEEATRALDGALIRAEQALDESRHSIQGLRPSLSAENDLDQMLITTGQELASSNHAEDGSPSFEVIVEGQRRGLLPMIKDEIGRIAQELLRNAFRHSRAHEIEVEIRYESDVFRLIVRDDGKGMDPQILKDGGRAGHWGLPGVQERARGIGSRLEFWSEAGAGTEIRLTLPAAVAYERPRNRDRLSLFGKRRIHELKSWFDSGPHR
jgi:ligand-binding sensor domain-containing protein/signal transduction histidine kinase